MNKRTSRILIVLAVLLLVGSTCFGQSKSTTFNLSLYLNEYIETMPGPVSVDLGHTFHYDYFNAETYGMVELNPWDFAYANCPFRVTITGDNPAGEGKPRFARLETGPHANGYDTFSTRYFIGFWINGIYGYGAADAKNFPYSWEYAEAPHNGQVKMGWSIYVNWPDLQDSVPMRQTLINPAFTWRDSVDAGVYTCSMTATLGAI